MRGKRYIAAGLLLVALGSNAYGAEAATAADGKDTIEAIIELLKDKKIITEGEAEKIISRHKASAKTEPEKVITIVPQGEQYLQTITDNVARDIREDVKKQVKMEIKDEIANEVKLEAYTGSVPGWTKRIRFGGDIRLRYQGDFFDKNNADLNDLKDVQKLVNTTEDRHRFRYRVRVSAKAKVNNQTEVGIRLATGNEEDPVSTNDTLGDYFNKDTVTFDRAYVKWTPIPETSTWTGDLNFWGGRFPNPFFYSDLVWDKDLNFEGLAMNLKAPFNTRWKGLVNLGIFPLEEVELSSDDKWLFGGQVGIEYAPRTTFNFKLAAAYYDYQNIEGRFNDAVGTYDYTAPRFFQEGNAIFDINEKIGGTEKFALQSDYNELNITSRLDLGMFDPIHINFLADFVKNIGFDQEEIFERTEQIVPKEDQGYQVGLTVGYPKMQELWDWQVYCFYKYLEADAVLDAFTDSDFGMGGTNAKGWILGGQLGVGKNFWLNSRWISTDEVAGPPVAVDTLQVDLNARF